MITEKNNVFYCDCGFSFQRGRSGSHDCADGLRNKLAESEVRYAALAAENARMKEEISNITFMRDDDFFGSTQRAQEVMGRLVNVKTPATDSFLAEVRASGVDYAIGVIKDCANNLCPGGMGEALQYAQEMVTPYLDSIHDKLADKSAQLRKGVQS